MSKYIKKTVTGRKGWRSIRGKVWTYFCPTCNKDTLHKDGKCEPCRIRRETT